MTKSFSLYALIAFVVLLGLQWFPIPGVILMMFGGPLLCGAAAQVFLLSLFFEAALGRIPRFLMIVPIAAYGGYYVMCVKQGLEIRAKAAEMRKSNPSLVLRFDPSLHSLVLPQSATRLVASNFDAPATYEAAPNFKPEGFLSYRLLDAKQCPLAQDAVKRLQEQKLHAGWIESVRLDDGFVRGICLLRFPETPPLRRIVVTRRGGDETWKRKSVIMEQFVDFSLDGKPFATYRTASVWRLSAIPFPIIGCYLNSGAPSWECGAELHRVHEDIDGAPEGTDESLRNSPEAVVLGLRKRNHAEYANFEGGAEASAFIARMGAYPREQAEYKAQRNAEMFAQFERFVRDTDAETKGKGIFSYLVHDGEVAPPRDMKSAILESPDRLVPLRGAIVARFSQLMQAKVFVGSLWVGLLVASLSELPRQAFIDMPDKEVEQLLDALSVSQGWRHFQSLYIRTGDAGPRALAFYERELSQFKSDIRFEQILAQAVCRIGTASDNTKEIFKADFRKSAGSDDYDDPVVLNSSLFVALLNLGERAFLDGERLGFRKEDVVGWYAAVKRGEGLTEIGPDNCRGWAGKHMRDRAESTVLRPGLSFRKDAWVGADAR